ncbi:hypothetical protein WN51_08932 [Melipona quadrifasciata]|uniref:Uncharacterized protein n=1 Tax=Melipona quadrifasciata TaxID=166423 RepID=A0A0N0BBF2_9HYME|nr:hypothetical protein WN51_08932 [Melipona quadrifasciata]
MDPGEPPARRAREKKISRPTRELFEDEDVVVVVVVVVVVGGVKEETTTTGASRCLRRTGNGERRPADDVGLSYD